MIYFLTNSGTQVQSLIGKYPFRNGLLSFVVLSRANRSEKLQGIILFPTRRYAVFFAPLVR
jgi:hypothetical protein